MIEASPIFEGSELFQRVRAIAPEGSVFHLLGHTPEQTEDIWVVLMDDRAVLTFETPRTVTGYPEKIEHYDLEAYRRGLRGIGAKELEAALKSAQALLKEMR